MNNKKFQAILFDLDGTLLPMDHDEFTKGYFGLLFKSVAMPLGIEKDTFVKGMWAGVAAMTANDGTKLNRDAFAAVFSRICNIDFDSNIEFFDEFYRTEFKKAVAFTQPSPFARKALDAAKQYADAVVLATNPLFPKEAVYERLRWAGIDPSEFALITNYENSSFCKPDPRYFEQIAKELSIAPENCLMVGNNEKEDANASAAAGFKTLLLTDCLIKDEDNTPICPRCTLSELPEMLKTI